MTDVASEFDRGTSVQALGEGRYTGHLDGGWVVGGGVNGGYVVAVAGRAVAVELADVGHTEPISVSTYFLTPSRPGPARIEVRRVRSGGRRTTVAVDLVQDEDGREVGRVTLLATYGSLEDGTVDRQLPCADLPPREECVGASFAPEAVVAAPLLERFATRLDPAYAGWAIGKPSGTGLIQGWFSLADGRDLDPLALLMVVDALPPATFDLGRPGWAPTLELTTHVRARPAPGPVVVRHATRTVAGGHFEEDCEVWDATGRLVAQSRQLALVPRT